VNIENIVYCIGWTVLIAGGFLLAALIVSVCVVRGTQKVAWANRNRAGFVEFLRWKAGVPPRGDRDAVILARMVLRAMDQMFKNGSRFGFSPNEADALDRWRFTTLPGEEEKL